MPRSFEQIWTAGSGCAGPLFLLLVFQKGCTVECNKQQLLKRKGGAGGGNVF